MGTNFLHVKPLPSALPWHMTHRFSSSYMKIKAFGKRKEGDKNLSAIALVIKKKKNCTHCNTLERKLGFALLLSLISSSYVSVHIQILMHKCDIQSEPWNGK